MTSLEDVIRSLLFRRPTDTPPAREAALSDFRNRYAGWERQPTTEPPSWPAEEFMRTKVSASDDAGTAYRFASGQAGGTGTEWEARWRLLPTPPAGARRLTLHFAPPGGPAVDVDFALPTD
jgi:hypothetical protein